MSENRYAIIIGINDYEKSPLNFCVNDALAIKKELTEKAFFKDEKVHIITSEDSQSTKDITGAYLNVLDKIKDTFVEEKDSIFFYFAGHGSNSGDGAVLHFHDSEYPIGKIFEDIQPLKSKFQFFVIDSCNSGGKVLTRGQNSNNIGISDHIEHSSGIVFLYACTEEQYAKESDSVQHGLMTNFFVEALNTNKLYDEEEIITPSRIQEYVAKKTSSSTNFTQTPVIEGRMTGYYPFASLDPAKHQQQLNASKVPTVSRNGIPDKSYTFETRLENQKRVTELLIKTLNEKGDITLSNYKIHNTTFDELGFNSRELKELIVNHSVNNTPAIGNVITKRRIPNPKYNHMSASLSSVLGPKYSSVPEEITEYRIDTDHQFCDSFFRIFRSDSIYDVSGGIGFVVYQAKWGIVVALQHFLLDWDGEKDCLLRCINKYDFRLMLGVDLEEKFKSQLESYWQKFEETLQSWIDSRKEEIEMFTNL